MESRVGIIYTTNSVKVRGHSLLEITLSLTIASIVILTGFQWFHLVKKEWLHQKTQIVQDIIFKNIYLYLSQDIEMCKYLGLRAKDLHFNIHHHLIDKHVLYQYQILPNPNQKLTDHFYKSVSGFTAPFNCTHHLPDALCRRLSMESDVLIVHCIGKQIYSLKQNLLDATDVIEIQAMHQIHKNSLVLITDVVQGDLFIANDVSNHRVYHQQSNLGNKDGKLSKAYQKSAEITALENVAYYLSEHVLYRDDFLHPAEAVITDIESFKVEYGVEVQGKVQFKKGGVLNEAEWKNIHSVRIKIETLHSKTAFEFEFVIPNRYSFTDGINSNNAHFISSMPFIAARFHNATCCTEFICRISI